MPRAIDSTSTKILKWFLTAPMAAAESMLDIAADALRSRRVKVVHAPAFRRSNPSGVKRRAPRPAAPRPRAIVKKAAKAAATPKRKAARPAPPADLTQGDK